MSSKLRPRGSACSETAWPTKPDKSLQAIGQNDEINFRRRSDRQWPRRAWRRYRVRPARRANLRPVRCLPAPQPDPDRIKAAAALIKDSKRPMIFVGSGAIHAREEILELAEMIDAPVVAFRSGRGIVSNAHELGLTMAAAYRLWPNTDLMIGIGTRLELPTMSRWPYRPDGLKSVRIDIDPVEMRRYVPDTAVIADAKAGTADLAAAVKKAGYSKSSGRRAE